MLFPTSGVEVDPLIPFLTAFFVSFFTSMGGVSGAFLLLPFQVSILGYTAPSVSATNQVFNVVGIPSGVYRYIRESRILWPSSLYHCRSGSDGNIYHFRGGGNILSIFGSILSLSLCGSRLEFRNFIWFRFTSGCSFGK